jgi:hypothetical protein
MAWLCIAKSAPGQPIVASHRRPATEDHGGCLAYFVVKKNVHQYIGTLLHKRKSG